MLGSCFCAADLEFIHVKFGNVIVLLISFPFLVNIDKLNFAIGSHVFYFSTDPAGLHWDKSFLIEFDNFESYSVLWLAEVLFASLLPFLHLFFSNQQPSTQLWLLDLLLCNFISESRRELHVGVHLYLRCFFFLSLLNCFHRFFF